MNCSTPTNVTSAGCIDFKQEQQAVGRTWRPGKQTNEQPNKRRLDCNSAEFLCDRQVVVFFKPSLMVFLKKMFLKSIVWPCDKERSDVAEMNYFFGLYRLNDGVYVQKKIVAMMSFCCHIWSFVPAQVQSQQHSKVWKSTLTVVYKERHSRATALLLLFILTFF